MIALRGSKVIDLRPLFSTNQINLFTAKRYLAAPVLGMGLDD